MDKGEVTADDLKRVKVTIKALMPDYQIEGVEPDSIEGKRMTITVPFSLRDYRKIKDAFDKGDLKTFGILSVSAEPLSAVGSEQSAFAKDEIKKRSGRKDSKSPPDRL